MHVPEAMENRPLIERLARHLAAGASYNWPYWVEDAANILALLKEPDDAMRQAGDTATWEAMVDAALRGRWTVFPPDVRDGDDDAGTDEEGEITLPPSAVDHNEANWVNIHKSSEESP